MPRAFVPLAILSLALLICMWGSIVGSALDPITTANTQRRPRSTASH